MPDFRAPYAQTALQLYNQLIEAGYSHDDLVRIRSAVDLSKRIFACRVHSSGKAFISHNVGAASVLASTRSDVKLVVAGIIHNAYGNGRFLGRELGTDSARREYIRRTVEPEVEEIVYNFAVTPWNVDTMRAWLAQDSLEGWQLDLLAVRLGDAVEHAMMFAMSYDPKGANWRRFDALRDAMTELSRRYGFDELADAWSSQLRMYEDYVEKPDVVQLTHWEPAIVRPASSLPGPKNWNVAFRRMLRRGLRRNGKPS